MAQSVHMNDNIDYFSVLPEEIPERILTYLDLPSLLKMHQVNLLFEKLTTNLIANHIHNSPSVMLENFNDSDSCNPVYRNGRLLFIRLSGFGNILRHLRHYHATIKCLSVDFYDASKFRQRAVLSHIFYYCRRHLIRFSMVYLTTRLEYPAAPFNRVFCVDFRNCFFQGTFSHIPELFPNVKDLKLGPDCRSRGTEVVNIIRNYPHLEFMKISHSLMDVRCFNLLCALNKKVFFAYSD